MAPHGEGPCVFLGSDRPGVEALYPDAVWAEDGFWGEVAAGYIEAQLRGEL